MMLLLLKRKISCFLLPCSSAAAAAAASTYPTTLVSFTNHLLTSIHGFSIATTQNPSPKSSYIVEYPIDSCGFPLDEAVKASKRLTHIKSPSQPNSVIRFLKQNGLNDTQIKTLVSKSPSTLCANVERTLEPRIKALREMGFSESEVVQLVEVPNALRTADLQLKIGLWKSLFGNNEDLLKAMRRNHMLLTSSLSKMIMPSLSLLRGYGILDGQILKIVSTIQFISPTLIKATVERADELGFSRSSGIFRQAFESLLSISRATLSAKFRFLKSLGWSEAEVLSAIRKQPMLLNLSEKKIRGAMEFLLKEAGCEFSYVVRRPTLLMYSLERRLVPRCFVLRVLTREELLGRGYDLLYVCTFSEDEFIEKFVLPHEVKVPGLHEAYIAASGKVPIQWKT